MPGQHAPQDDGDHIATSAIMFVLEIAWALLPAGRPGSANTKDVILRKWIYCQSPVQVKMFGMVLVLCYAWEQRESADAQIVCNVKTRWHNEWS